jgi:hypothetical protein
MNKKISMKKLKWISLMAFFCIIKTSAQNVLLNENFISGSQPSGWWQDSAGVTPFYQWTYNNPGGRNISGMGFDSHFVIFDGDFDGANNSQNCFLNIVSLNASALSSLYIIMDEQHRAYGGQWHQIEVSVDNGVNWTHLLSDSVSDVGYPAVVHSVYNISFAAGQPSVRIRFHYAGTYGWWWAIDNLIISDVPCTLPVAACPAASSIEYACTTDSFNLSLPSSLDGYGLSYQWQQSPNGISWSNIPGANDSLYRTLQTIPNYYRCKVSCGTSWKNSDSVLVRVNPNPMCYCIPYNYICTGTDYISNVSIAATSINYSSYCDSLFPTAYSFIVPSSSSTDTLFAGQTYSVSVTTNNNDIVSLWIDYDQSGTYDANEWTQVCTNSVSGIPNSVNVIIPLSALSGQTGMRIRSRSAGNVNNASSACIIAGSGEIEDYIISISLPVGIQEVEFHDVSVFPCPSAGIINIDFGKAVSSETTLKIFDPAGNLMSAKKINHTSRGTFDISEFSEGVYILNIENRSGSRFQKLLLNK